MLAALVYLCYGGGFGTMPSTAGKFFGVKNVGAIYGLMLIGWSIGGVVGPLLIASLIGSEKAYTLGFTVIGIITLVALVLPLVTKPPRRPDEASAAPSAGAASRSTLTVGDEDGPSLPHVRGLVRQRQPRGEPGLDAPDDVGGALQPDRPQRRRGERAAVALTTDDDDPGLGVPHLWDAVGAGRVEAPLEHRAVDDESVGQLSLSGSLRGRAGVDEQGAGADLVPGLVRASGAPGPTRARARCSSMRLTAPA